MHFQSALPMTGANNTFRLVVDQNERMSAHAFFNADRWFPVCPNMQSSNTTKGVCPFMEFQGADVVGRNTLVLAMLNRLFSSKVAKFSQAEKSVLKWYDTLGWDVQSCNRSNSPLLSLACKGTYKQLHVDSKHHHENDRMLSQLNDS